MSQLAVGCTVTTRCRAVNHTAGMPGLSTMPRVTMAMPRCGAMAVAAEAARSHRE